MNSLPRVGVVILNWNNAPDTLECLESVRRLVYPVSYALVVDNGSTDGSAERIAAEFPEIDLLRLEKNLGYGAGNNAGISLALQQGVDYILVLNNDTLLDPAMLNYLVETAESDPAIAMTGPLMYCANPPDWIFAAGSLVDWQRGDVIHRGMFKPSHEVSLPREPQDVDFIAGCGLLVRSTFIQQVGALNPDYYLNYEDVEWGILARRRGWRVVFVPSAILWHKISATLGLASPANTYYMTRNSLAFFARWLPLPQRALTLGQILARTTRTVAAWSLRPRYRAPEFRQKRNANLAALRDFFLGRWGVMPVKPLSSAETGKGRI